MTERPREYGLEAGDGSRETVEERLVELVAEHYRPEPETFEQRAAFDRRLRARIDKERARAATPGWLRSGPVIAAASALALVWWLFPVDWRTPFDERPPERVAAIEGADAPGGGGLSRASSEPEAFVPMSVTAAVDGWAGEVLGSVDAIDSMYADDSELLPDDYLAIASVFLGDV